MHLSESCLPRSCAIVNPGTVRSTSVLAATLVDPATKGFTTLADAAPIETD